MTGLAAMLTCRSNFRLCGNKIPDVVCRSSEEDFRNYTRRLVTVSDIIRILTDAEHQLIRTVQINVDDFPKYRKQLLQVWLAADLRFEVKHTGMSAIQENPGIYQLLES